MYIYANTQQIRAGAQKFLAAASEFQAKAQRLGLSENSLLEGASGWQGQGADAFQRVMEHLREDLRATSEAMTQAAGTLNVLAMQLDQVNQMHQQAEQLEHQIRSLDNRYWSADDMQRESIRHEISHLRERHTSLLHQAQLQERQANDAAAAAFDRVGANVNRLHFHQEAHGGWKEAASTALQETGEFFGRLWGKTKQIAHQAEETVEDFFEDVVEEVTDDLAAIGDFAEGFTAQYLYNETMELADPLHEEFPEDRSAAYRMGRIGGDIFSAAEGVLKMVGGGAMAAGGGAEAVLTSETVVLPATRHRRSCSRRSHRRCRVQAVHRGHFTARQGLGAVSQGRGWWLWHDGRRQE
jgi:hypothetical protein